MMIAYLYLILGILVGSFLNVCIYRIPKKEDVIIKSSYCPVCGQKIKWYHLIPILSYFFLKGKCGYCGEKISLRYPCVEACNGILWFLLALQGRSFIETGLNCIFVSALIVAGMVDLDTFEIPPATSYSIMILGGLHLVSDPAHWSRYVLGFFCISIFLVLLFYITKGKGIGGGDIKLMAASGLFLGWSQVLLGFVLACILGSLFHSIRMWRKKVDHVLAFGPYLAAGMIITVLYGESFLTWYKSFIGW